MPAQRIVYYGSRTHHIIQTRKGNIMGASLPYISAADFKDQVDATAFDLIRPGVAYTAEDLAALRADVAEELKVGLRVGK